MNSKGFTLIELIIAIFILSVAIIGVFSAFSLVAELTSAASSRLKASFLAQEGLEIIRNMRDSNWLQGNGWTDGILIEPCGTTGCEADYRTGMPGELGLTSYGLGGRLLKIDSYNFYSYDTGQDTKFKRKITITQPEQDVLRVSVMVMWDEKNETYSFQAEEYLYNWY